MLPITRKDLAVYLLQSYDDALRQILDQGVSRTNKRTKIKTLSVFGMLNRYRLDTGFFPILTRRKVWPKSVFSELLWFLSGSTSNKDLKSLGCNFWNPWVDHEFEKKNGFDEETFGPVYGFQLRHFGGNYNKGIHQEPHYGFGGFDQLKWVVDRIKEDHSCRRTLWTLWNPQDVGQMRLPPCHMMFQVLVDDERRLTGIMYQRSCDFPIGVPANIQFYSALTIMLAQQTGCTPFEFVHVTADSHIYENQIDGVRAYLEAPIVDSPSLVINKATDIFSYKPEDFVVSNFNSGPKIDIPVAV
jgi:thymidylate synthase